jgi:2-enoate reductase
MKRPEDYESYELMLEDMVQGFASWFTDQQTLESGKMTKNLYPYTELFKPLRINGVKVKNRIVMGPMGNISMADELGRPSEKMISYFVERARGGAGLITTGLVPVSHYIDPSVTELGDRSYFPRIDKSRTVYSGWRDLAEGVHVYGSRIFIQLTPGLGRVGSPECLLKKLKMPVSASWNPNFYLSAIPCRLLTDRQCKKIIRSAAQLSADAKALLIDGVYLHGHEGYLLEQMTNPAFNRRRLGRYSKWQQFGLDLVRAIRESCGPTYPIMYRIDLSLALKATYGSKMKEISSLKKFSNERTVEMTLSYMANLVQAGVDIFDVDLGSYDNWWLPHPPATMPPGCYRQLSGLVKKHFAERGVRSNAGFEVPVVAVGKLGYPDLAEQALREGLCDMVMLARPLLADPQWPNKVYSGKVEEIVPCIGDQEGCINEFIHGGHPQCAVNPRTGFEEIFSAEPSPAARLKQVAVVGAGPGGVTCACLAAARGHKVTLFEKNNRAGGALLAGSVPHFKFDVKNYLEYLNYEVEKAQKTFGLKVEFNSEIRSDQLVDQGYDTIILATGSKTCLVPIDGIDLPHVVQAVDLLKNFGPAAGKNKILIIGGGDVGCETAYYLACEKDMQVTVVEMLPYFMKETCTANRGHILHSLEKAGVKLWNCSRVKSIESGGVTVIRNTSPTVPNPYNTWAPVLPDNIKNPIEKPIKIKEQAEKLEVDLVVLACGLVPDDRLYESCVIAMAAPEILHIGDSFSVGGVFEATKAGYRVGRSI